MAHRFAASCSDRKPSWRVMCRGWLASSAGAPAVPPLSGSTLPGAAARRGEPDDRGDAIESARPFDAPSRPVCHGS